MAVQPIEQSEAKGSKGKKRGINKGATGLVMDIVQSQQYKYPTESTVRELTANAVDSQSEKDRALEILSGKADSSKYFVERTGELYADSKWDPGYYSTDHLDTDHNDVELIYKEGSGGGRCDTFIIKDYGVGIGQGRLEGVLELGYSTKRNRTDALGAFGIGAKVALSTECDFYTITSVYNGVKHIVKVFSRKINSMIGKLDFESGEKNVPYTFSDGEVIYGERTDEKNYTIIEVPVLKHQKDDYIRGVETQLLYFSNVRFYIENVDGGRSEHNFKAKVLHNSGNLIISEKSPYSKPHIVIVKGGTNDSTGVCYGHVSFKDLELEEMSGDIGIKCPIRQVMENEDGEEIVLNEGVDVIPSREAVRWTKHTKDFLMKQFKEAQEEATSLVESELKQTDFIKWIDACKNISHYSSRGSSAIGRLSRIVDLDSLMPKFPGSTYKFESVNGLFDGFRVVTNTKFLDKEDDKFRVKRENANGWNSINTAAMYVKTTNASRHQDCYVADQHGGTFTTLQPKSNEDLGLVADQLVTAKKVLAKNRDNWLAKKISKRDAVLALLRKSTEYRDYDVIDIPDDYVSNLTKLETKQEESVEEVIIISDAERRKLQEKVVYATFVDRYMPYKQEDGETYQRSKREMKFKDIKDYEGTLYYGFDKDMEKLQFACHLIDAHNVRNGNTEPNKFHNDDYMVVKIAKNNEKHFKTHKHIDTFFGKTELTYDDNKTVTGCNIIMDNAIVHWNTARLMETHMKELLFMTNFGPFNEDVHNDYLEVKTYMDRYYSSLTGYQGRLGMDKHYGDFLTFLAKVEKIQTMSEDGSSAEEIADKVKEFALPGGISGGLAVNTEMLALQEKLRGYASTVKHMLNSIPLLTASEPDSMSMEVTMEINKYLDWKDVSYEKEEDSIEDQV